MDWKEAASMSESHTAVRFDNHGRMMLKNSIGAGQIETMESAKRKPISIGHSRQTREADSGELDGYFDWQPMRPLI